MKPELFQAVYPKLYSWIQTTIAEFRDRAESVASLGFARLPQYFSTETLTSTKVVVVDRLPKPSLTAMGIAHFAEFEKGQFGGITYQDTFFVTEQNRGNEVLYFHEMIHVIQWHLLGPERFLGLYADGLEKFGYRDSPLEAMAYHAEAVFQSSTELFDAEKFVAAALTSIYG